MTRYLLSLLMLCTVTSCFNGSKSSNQGSFNVADVAFDQETHAVVVLGGGVAGLTAATYLAQAEIPTMVLEGKKPGGALAQSDSVRNWPGVLQSPGVDIVRAMKQQVQKNGVTIAAATVLKADFDIWPYRLEVKDNATGKVKTIKTLACVIATGTEPNYLKIPGEKQFWGKGVTNCAVCDGPLYKDKVVGVVGGGDAAVAEVLYLARIAKEVHMFVRRDVFRAKDKKALERMKKLSNLFVHHNTHVLEVVGSRGKVAGAKLNRNPISGKSNDILALDGLFLAIGSRPNSAMFTEQLLRDKQGYVTVVHDQQTTVPGVFAAGDVCDPVYKQAVTSAGDGCRAALQAQEFLTGIGFDAATYWACFDSSPKVPVYEDVQVQKAQKQIAVSGSTGMTEVTSKSHLAQLIAKHPKGLVIDVAAPLCISCQAMEPVMNNLSAQFGSRIGFVHADISHNNVDAGDIEQLVGGAGITTMPTFIFVKDGKEVHRFEGEKPQHEVEDLVQKYLL